MADALAAAAGVMFLVLCMLLPLVGPAAARGSGSPGATRAEHYGKNVAAFLSVLTLTTALAVAAVLLRRDNGRRDRIVWAMAAIAAACIGLLVAFLTGALQA